MSETIWTPPTKPEPQPEPDPLVFRMKTGAQGRGFVRVHMDDGKAQLLFTVHCGDILMGPPASEVAQWLVNLWNAAQATRECPRCKGEMRILPYLLCDAFRWTCLTCHAYGALEPSVEACEASIEQLAAAVQEGTET